MKISMYDSNIRGVTIMGLELSVDDSNVTTDDLFFALKRRSITGPVVRIDAGKTSVQQIMDECLLLLVDGLSLGNQAKGADGPEQEYRSDDEEDDSSTGDQEVREPFQWPFEAAEITPEG